jgi:hypothetical protein
MIAGTQQRVREFLAYRNAGDHLLVWGALWMLGYGATHFLARSWPNLIGPLWLGIVTVGALATLLIVRRERKDLQHSSAWDVRPAISAFAFLFFGVTWSFMAHLGWREQAAFLPTLFGVLFFVLGLWLGRLFAVFGAVLYGLTVLGYFLAGGWFDLWMAFVGGGALIASGLWLKG